jgi:hypothetical protein
MATALQRASVVQPSAVMAQAKVPELGRARVQVVVQLRVPAPAARVLVALVRVAPGLVVRALVPAELLARRYQLQVPAVVEAVVRQAALRSSLLKSLRRTFRPKGRSTCASSSSFRTKLPSG